MQTRVRPPVMNDPTKEKIAEITKKVAESKHMSKPPGSPNTIVFRDETGRWICEIYTVGHTLSGDE